MRNGSGIHGQNPDRKRKEDQNLKLHGEVGSGEGDHAEKHAGTERDEQISRSQRRKIAAYGFRKTENVEGNGDPLCEKQCHADGAAESGTQGPGNQKIDAAAFDRSVGGNGGNGKRRRHDDAERDCQNNQRIQDAGASRDVVDAQEHDRAEHRQDRGQDNSVKRAEIVPRVHGRVFSFLIVLNGTHAAVLLRKRAADLPY